MSAAEFILVVFYLSNHTNKFHTTTHPFASKQECRAAQPKIRKSVQSGARVWTFCVPANTKVLPPKYAN